MSKASQVAIVTGSSTGIGFETSIALARKRVSHLCHYARFE